MALRIAFGIVTLIAALFMPWWFTMAFVLALLFLFPKYYEALLLGLIMDVVFGAPTALFNEFTFVFTALFAVLLVAVLLIKRELREDLYVS